MATTGILVIAALVAVLAYSEASQLIRLRSGRDCPMPGYFRDEFNCQKFYYCPGVSKSELPERPEDMLVLNEIRDMGLTCPDDTIFDEVIRECQHLALVKSIPPECQAERKTYVSQPETRTGVVPQIFSNNH